MDTKRQYKTTMTIPEIFNWIQNNNCVFHTVWGAEAVRELIGDMGSEFQEVFANESLEGYKVEIALHTDLASWAYKSKLNDAIIEAFEALIEMAIEEGYIEKETLKLILPFKGGAQAWRDCMRYNFEKGKVEHREYYSNNGKWL